MDMKSPNPPTYYDIIEEIIMAHRIREIIKTAVANMPLTQPLPAPAKQKGDTKMDYKLIIFDVDGTLTETKSGAQFRQEADDWQWLPNRLTRLRQLKQQGIRLAIATNQGGVAFGYMEMADVLYELDIMCKECGVSPGGLYICYNHPKATIPIYKHDDDRRKPRPGMLRDAMKDFDADPDETLMVGDRPEDFEAAKNAGCAFSWATDFFGDF